MKHEIGFDTVTAQLQNGAWTVALLAGPFHAIVLGQPGESFQHVLDMCVRSIEVSRLVAA